MKKSSSSWRIYFQIIQSAVLLYIFYKLGFSLYVIIIMGLVLLLLILFKGKLYRNLDDFLSRKFPFLSKLNPLVKKLIIIAVFVLIYILLKQIIFLILKQFGIDVQQIITESINQSIE